MTSITRKLLRPVGASLVAVTMVSIGLPPAQAQLSGGHCMTAYTIKKVDPEGNPVTNAQLTANLELGESAFVLPPSSGLYGETEGLTLGLAPVGGLVVGDYVPRSYIFGDYWNAARGWDNYRNADGSLTGPVDGAGNPLGELISRMYLSAPNPQDYSAGIEYFLALPPEQVSASFFDYYLYIFNDASAQVDNLLSNVVGFSAAERAYLVDYKSRLDSVRDVLLESQTAVEATGTLAPEQRAALQATTTGLPRFDVEKIYPLLERVRPTTVGQARTEFFATTGSSPQVTVTTDAQGEATVTAVSNQASSYFGEYCRAAQTVTWTETAAPDGYEVNTQPVVSKNTDGTPAGEVPDTEFTETATSLYSATAQMVDQIATSAPTEEPTPEPTVPGPTGQPTSPVPTPTATEDPTPEPSSPASTDGPSAPAPSPSGDPTSEPTASAPTSVPIPAEVPSSPATTTSPVPTGYEAPRTDDPGAVLPPVGGPGDGGSSANPPVPGDSPDAGGPGGVHLGTGFDGSRSGSQVGWAAVSLALIGLLVGAGALLLRRARRR